MRLLLLAAAGGAIGSAARHLVNVAALRIAGPAFPWGTLFVNITGSFLMGLVVTLVMARPAAPLAQDLRVFLATGILGGYTTFSAFSLEFVLLLERRALTEAAHYLAGSVVLSILALVAGLAVARALVQ